MKFILQAQEIHDDQVRLEVIHDFGDGSAILATCECNLDLVNGQLVLHVSGYNTSIKPQIAFEFGTVSEVHRRRPIRDSPQA